MIELQYLASAFNKLFGTDDFEVHLNTNLIPDDTNPKTICTMVALRVPFAIQDVNSETLQLTFTFDLIASDDAIRDKRLALIKDVLGWKSFQITTPDNETYNCDSFLEQQPLGLPRIDTSVTIQQVVVSGTCLVAVSGLGALVSNRINTYIDNTPVKVISSNSQLEKGTDSLLNLSGDSSLVDVREISRGNTAEYTLLYTGSDLDNDFIKYIESGNESDSNRIYTVRRVYPSFEIQNTVKLISGTVIQQAGAYLLYKVNFQKVEVEED